jgi:8-oxo-dGTP diphosphatase
MSTVDEPGEASVDAPWKAEKPLWSEGWMPTEKATLCFVIRNGEVLLIRKKRGLGAGKINAPGGRIEPGESPLEAAIRETEEELCVTPIDPQLRGELHFQFADGYALHCCVFAARDCEGEPRETDEATPLWTPVDAIPYYEMWADDIHWLPGVLSGGTFRGFFEFDGERMLSNHVDWRW